MTLDNDSIKGVHGTLKKCALISKYAGGIGLNVHCIRATGPKDRYDHESTNGLIPVLKLYNDIAIYVDQGGNKRPGAFAIYLEPWHADIFAFLELKRNIGNFFSLSICFVKCENAKMTDRVIHIVYVIYSFPGDPKLRARDLFYGLWIPDLFMERVYNDETWSLMCPYESPGLADVWGDEFKELYTKYAKLQLFPGFVHVKLVFCIVSTFHSVVPYRYEKEGRYKKQIMAREVWLAILRSQVETGTPYMLYKDHCNRKSNQQHMGTIKCSNLCTEVVEYSSPDEVAVCNLASIAVNMFVNATSKTFDFEKLKLVTKIVTRNLDKVIDVNFYPISEAKKSNQRHRPIGKIKSMVI